MYKFNNMKDLGVFVRKVRKSQALTQERLSLLTNVGVRFIRDMENGKETCQINKVFRVLNLLGIEIIFSDRVDIRLLDDHITDMVDKVVVKEFR